MMTGFKMLIGAGLAWMAMGAAKAEAATYTCKKVSNGYCAVNLQTNQCTHSFREQDGGKYACMQHLGLIKTKVDRSNYYCKADGSGACAVDRRTGQCTHSWREGSARDSMWSCEQWMGNVRTGIDRTGYFCRESGSSVCAVNPRTNQCTVSWRKNEGDAWGSCQSWIRR